MQTLHASTPSILTQEPATSVEDRRAAWQVRGAAHDRTVRRTMTIAMPILLAVVSVLYVVFAR
jgi:hypothetical protein